MSITKFVSIRNVGRFKNYNADGNVALKRVNLVFAENGRGKSTLCAILRSAQSNDPDLVIGRTTLGATDAPHVHLVTSVGTVLFKTGAWTQPMPQLAIFDSTYIAENVFSGDTIDLDHKRNLYRLIIGKAGVTLAQKVTDLDEKVRAATSDIRVKRAAIDGRVPAGYKFETFVALEADPQIDQKIVEKERELEAVQQSAQLRTRTGLGQLTIPEVPAGIAVALLQTIDGVSANVEQRVAAHVAKHRMEKREAWLQEGLGYIQEDTCPFCDQSLAGVALVPSLSAFFGEAYQQLKATIVGLRERVASSFSDRAVAEVERVVETNTAAVEFWSRYVPVAAPSLSSPQGIGRSIRALREALLSLLDKKSAVPLEPVQIDQRLNTAANVVDALRASALEYNQAVSKANTLVSDKKKSLEDANVASVQQNLQNLRAVKARHTPEAVKACSDHSEAVKKKDQLEQQKEAARKELDEHTKTVIGTYEKTINRLLADFQAGFRITGTKHAYPGGIPSSSFQILINDTTVELGDGDTPLRKPSFRNTLSSGDKSTLALAFFLAELEHDPNKASKIVVFDDPFNSQDAFRKDHTIKKIRKCGDTCLQVIVLSHDQNCLKRLYDGLRAQGLEYMCLHLARIGHANTIMTFWDIEEATQLQFRADIKTLTTYYNAGLGKPRDVVDKIRPVLESYCRNLLPTQFDDDDTLGVICGKIRNGGPDHPLAAVCDDLDTINEYTRRYHYGENPNAASEPLNDSELQGMVGTALSIVGCTN
jgi:wobble nucleotide-excising tRNase